MKTGFKKYGAKRTVIDGITFDSMAEARRFERLKELQKAGEIGDIVVHPLYTLVDKTTLRNGEKLRAVRYEADFRYYDTKSKKTIVEDVKGFPTQAYKIKKNLFLRTLDKDTIFVEVHNK